MATTLTLSRAYPDKGILAKAGSRHSQSSFFLVLTLTCQFVQDFSENILLFCYTLPPAPREYVNARLLRGIGAKGWVSLVLYLKYIYIFILYINIYYTIYIYILYYI